MTSITIRQIENRNREYITVKAFVCGNTKPIKTKWVLSVSFFGIVTGFWAIPHPISKGGTCDDEF